jgi:formylglycine-generating enzyme required for sulfatase activity
MFWKIIGVLLGCIAMQNGVVNAQAGGELEGSSRGMVLVSAGTFTMGSPNGVGKKDEQPAHQVYLDAFYIDRHPVTFDQYDRFCDATQRTKPDDSGWGRGRRPVINVSWDDATAYSQWAGKRLPTEAEYEKAARGGTNTLFFWGDDPLQAGDYAWIGANSGGQTHPVEGKKPNPCGIYDISGNIWEWCADSYGAKYYATSPAKDPQGPAKGTAHVMRGGSWYGAVENARPASRNGIDRAYRKNLYGFRCVRTL